MGAERHIYELDQGKWCQPPLHGFLSWLFSIDFVWVTPQKLWVHEIFNFMFNPGHAERNGVLHITLRFKCTEIHLC